MRFLLTPAWIDWARSSGLAGADIQPGLSFIAGMIAEAEGKSNFSRVAPLSELRRPQPEHLTGESFGESFADFDQVRRCGCGDNAKMNDWQRQCTRHAKFNQII